MPLILGAPSFAPLFHAKGGVFDVGFAFDFEFTLISSYNFVRRSASGDPKHRGRELLAAFDIGFVTAAVRGGRL
jgi:hypothetical protein